MSAKLTTLKGNGFEITYTTFGGLLVSYKAKGREHLYTGPHAKIGSKDYTHAGVPVCWPWFGPTPEPLHAIARQNEFKLVKSEETPDKLYVEMTFSHEKLVLTEKITATKDKLYHELSTTNNGEEVPFQTGLHTYFAVDALDKAIMKGFEGCKYINRAENTNHTFHDGPYQFKEWVDYALEKQNNVVEVIDGDHKFKITMHGNNYVVLWTPWEKLSKEIPDLGADEYKKFVCIESVFLFGKIAAGETKNVAYTLDV